MVNNGTQKQPKLKILNTISDLTQKTFSCIVQPRGVSFILQMYVQKKEKYFIKSTKKGAAGVYLLQKLLE
jgi:hypothetical protein